MRRSYPSIEAFTEQTGIEVEYDEGLLDNADFLAQYAPDLRAGNNTGWDVMSPGGWVVERMARLGWLEELDHSKLPNWTANVADYAKGLWFDPDNKYSVWWQGGITGIAYDPELTGREVTTFDDLLDPEFSGRAGGFSDMRDMFGLTLLSLGVEPANATVDDVQAAQDKLLGVPDGHFRGFYGNEYYDALAAGDLAISVAWSGDISQMNLYDNDKVRVRRPRVRRHALERQPRHPEGRGKPGERPQAAQLLVRPGGRNHAVGIRGLLHAGEGRRRADRGRCRDGASR